MYFEKLILLFLFISCCLLNDLIKSQTLEVINDDELLDLFHSENHVLVLFTLKDCNKCKKYEETLTQVREEIVDSLNAWVVKVEGSNLVHIYDPTKEPTLVMFRYGIPLLIPESDAVNEELLIDMILNNKDPIVKELNDNNFEHLTQASTGATTGDWFIKFYSSDSIACQRLQAQWETVGAKLKNRVNVARINRHIAGATIARRFNINQSPTFILLRRGAMYKYTLDRVTVESLLKFVEEDYDFTVKIQVPQPKSTFDDFIHMCFDVLNEHSFLWKLNLVVFIIITTCIIILKRKIKQIEYVENEPKLKKQKTSSKKSTKKSK